MTYRRTHIAYSRFEGARAAEILRALQAVEFRVYKELTSVMLEWEVPQTLALPEDAQWIVERAGAPAGPFEMILGELDVGTRAFRDDHIPLNQNQNSRVYYRLRLVSDSGGLDMVYGFTAPWLVENVVFGMTWGPMGKRDWEVPAAVKEIRKRHYTLMTMRQAELFVVFREAWDREVDHNQVSNAGSTYKFLSQPTGSDRVQRWYRPFLMYATELKAAALGPVGAQMLYWPHPQPGDVLRSLVDGAIFKIDFVNPIEMHRFPVHYECSVSQVSDLNAVSQIPLPPEYKELSPTPRRQFARASNLESYRESLTDGAMSHASIRRPSTYIVDDD